MVDDQQAGMIGPKQGPVSTSARIAHGASWNIAGQITPMVITIFLTPYILHGLGVTRYGLFVFTASLVGFLGTFDGGVKETAQRYFAIYAGQDDVERSTRLLVTLLLVIAALGAVASTVGWILAAPLVSILHMPAGLRSESLFLLRTLGILITFGFIHNLFVGILQAYGRFAYIIKAGFGIYAVWAAGLVLTVHSGWGLRGIAVVFIVQQVLLTVVIMPASLGYTSRSHIGLLSRTEIKEFLSFSSRVQLSAVSFLVNTEFDTLIIGTAVSVRTVAFYNAGNNFATNVASIPYAALGPAQTAMGNTFGRDGEQAAYAQYKRLQHVWVVGLAGWFAVASGAAYFAIEAWLGSEFRAAGVIAIIALATQGVLLSSGVLRTYCTVSGRPGLESRFGFVSVGVNVALTIPLLLTGAIGVASATCAGQVVGLIYLVRLVRSRLGPDVPNPMRSVPVLACLASAAVVVVIELLIRPLVPGGGLGLLACALPAPVGLVLYLSVVVGPRTLLTASRGFLGDVTRAGSRAAISHLVEQVGA